MDSLRNQLKKEDFNEVMSLYSKQSWIISREQSLLELLSQADDYEKKRLLIDLLLRFNFLDNASLNRYLQLMSNFIINESGFDQETTIIGATTVMDDEADSSQKILDYLKVYLLKEGGTKLTFVNKFGAIGKNYRKGKKQIIIVDEFVGSGVTILNRIKTLHNDIKDDFELKFCFVAGMKPGIKLIEEAGFEVFCPLLMDRGISDFYSADELEYKIQLMNSLEELLLQDINEHNLAKFTFGYNRAEALYSLEGERGNTPNSVFPIFWWPKNRDEKDRNRLLFRYEPGLI